MQFIVPRSFFSFAVCFTLFSSFGPKMVNSHAAETKASGASIIGRWDLVMNGQKSSFPSWLEVRRSGRHSLVGSFVGQFGSARPIAKIESNKNRFQFEIPPQWENRTDDQVFVFSLSDGKLKGETTDENGQQIMFTGKRAPLLKRTGTPKWGTPIDLFNGSNLNGWKTQLKNVKNGWVVQNGMLFNKKPGNNLVTVPSFQDFKLRAEFRYPQGSNSGIYLRGRYEIQIEDNFGDEPDSHKIGGVYGFLTPAINAAKPAGEWQQYDITLIGRTLTVVLNGERIIDRQAIPGITGGALDSNEEAPGPILLQGDHGPVEFRVLRITPAEN